MKYPERVIYKKGEINLQTTVTDDRCDFTYKDGEPNLTVDKYLKQLGPEFSCVPFDAALKQIEQAEEIAFIHPWKEISEKDYNYYLEVLPPEKWETVGNVNIFRMSEYLTGNITCYCVSYRGVYFSANRRTTESYNKIAGEIANLFT